MYSISMAAPKQQGLLRDIYNETVARSAVEAKVSHEEMHASILAGNAIYCCERAAGKSHDEAFEASRLFVISRNGSGKALPSN